MPEKTVLAFAYRITDSREGYKRVLEKLMPIRIYREITEFEDSMKADLSRSVEFESIKSAITALMGEQRESHTPDSPDEDISVVPLAIPICMGPASIGTLMVLGASAHSMTERIIGSAALFVASALITLMLLMANHVQRILGKTGLAVLSKLTGLLLAAIAAQVVFTGVKNFLIVG